MAALLVLGTLDLVQHYHADPITAYALAAVRTVPVLMYRRWPAEAWLLELAAVIGTALVTVPVSSAEPWPWSVTSVASTAVVAGLVSSLGLRHLSRIMFAVMIGLSLLLLVVWPVRGEFMPNMVAAVVCAAAIIAGDVAHSRRSIAAELAEERQVSAAEREQRSVVEERARIARELHDVVAHHMSMITVQAETARFRHEGLPDAAVAEFTEIAAVARASLSELRGLLAALRDDGADPHRTPQPTMADLPALVDRITAAGTQVTMTVATNTTDLPQVVQLAVYRIVQEGLSNVVRHAGNARTWVAITRANNALKVEVTNERPPTPRPPPESQGHGLIGLRERCTLLGGTFEVDQPNDGWRIRATLPLTLTV